jgi:FkbM family methyltransferase
MLSRYGMHPGGALTQIKVNGCSFIAPNNAESWGIADQVWREKVYVKHFPILKSYRVLDVGAHFGFFSVFAGRQNADIKVVSYEPSQGSFEILRKNLDKNLGSKNSSAFNFGLSDTRRESVFYKPAGHDASGTLFKENLGQNAVPIIEERVQIEEANRIWEVFDAYDFAKLDCEGAEFAILRCLGDRITRLHYLVLEYHQDPREIIQLLSSKNFSIVETVPLESSAPWNAFSQLGMLYAVNRSF